MSRIRRTGGVVVLGTLGLALLPGEARAHPAEDLPAGQWMELSLNTIDDVDPCPSQDCSYSAVEGISGTVNDWNGGALASGFGALGGLIAWGGGHNGYFGSEVYVFDIDSRLWVRYTEPYDDGSDSVAGACNGEGVYPDGSACPPHTYDRVGYYPPTNAFVVMFSTTDPVCGGCGSANAHLFSFDSDAWSLGGTHPQPPISTGASSAYDPSREIFWLLPGYNGVFSSYDPAAGGWTTYNTYNIAIDAVSAVDPGRDLFVTVDGRGTNTVIVHNLADPRSGGVTVSVDGSSPIMESGANGFEWDPASEQFVGWAGGTEVWTLAPPQGDWQTQDWQWLRVDAAEGNPVVPSAPNSNGTYSRWRYVPSLNIFVVINRVGDPVFAYRLSDAPGVGPNPPGGSSGGDDAGGSTEDAGSGAADGGGTGGSADAGVTSGTNGPGLPPAGTRGDSTGGLASAGGDGGGNGDAGGCGCQTSSPPAWGWSLVLFACLGRGRRRWL